MGGICWKNKENKYPISHKEILKNINKNKIPDYEENIVVSN